MVADRDAECDVHGAQQRVRPGTAVAREVIEVQRPQHHAAKPSLHQPLHLNSRR